MDWTLCVKECLFIYLFRTVFPGVEDDDGDGLINFNFQPFEYIKLIINMYIYPPRHPWN